MRHRSITLVLILGTMFSCFFATAQNKFNQHFAGKWRSGKTTVQLFFSLNCNNKLRLKLIDTSANEQVKVLSFKVKGDTFFSHELYKPTHFITRNKYFLQDKDILVNIVLSGTTKDTLLFNRVQPIPKQQNIPTFTAHKNTFLTRTGYEELFFHCLASVFACL